jgi:excisionase family DNA binding protein
MNFVNPSMHGGDPPAPQEGVRMKRTIEIHTPTEQIDIPPLAYCVEDAAIALGVGRTLIFRLIRDGYLPAVKIGRRTLIALSDLDSFLTKGGVR